MKYCTQCGRQNSASAKFCLGCGNMFEFLAAPETTPKPNPSSMLLSQAGSPTLPPKIETVTAFEKPTGGFVTQKVSNIKQLCVWFVQTWHRFFRTISPQGASQGQTKNTLRAPSDGKETSLRPKCQLDPLRNYFYLDDYNEAIGPHTPEELGDLARRGMISGATLVSGEGDQVWTKWQDIERSSATHEPQAGASTSSLGEAKLGSPFSTSLAPASSVPTMLPVQPVTDSPYYGYGGWLRCFCQALFIYTVFTILLLSWNLLGDDDVARYLARNYPRANFLMKLEIIIWIGINGFGFYIGIMLWRLRPGAVSIVKRYLQTCLGLGFLAIFVPLVYGVPSRVREALMHDAAHDFGRILLSFAIWFKYFKVSKRIKATFPNG